MKKKNTTILQLPTCKLKKKITLDMIYLYVPPMKSSFLKTLTIQMPMANDKVVTIVPINVAFIGTLVFQLDS